MQIVYLAQGSEKEGFGHISRCKQVLDHLSTQESVSSQRLLVDGDEYIHQKLLDNGTHFVSAEIFGDYVEADVLVFDGYLLSNRVSFEVANHPLSICLSPKIDPTAGFSRWFLRSRPEHMPASAVDDRLQCSPSYGLLSPSEVAPARSRLARDELSIGVCMGGGRTDIDLSAVFGAIVKAGVIAEIRLLNYLLPVSEQLARNIRRLHWSSNPWDTHFADIDLFVGAGGVMCLEALQRGVPVIEVNTSENLMKNKDLVAEGYYVQVNPEVTNPTSLVHLIAKILDGRARVVLSEFVDKYKGKTLSESVLRYSTQNSGDRK